MEQLSTIFRQANLRLTEPRRQVFTALSQSDVPLTISGIIERCPSINRTTIYRVLELFYQLKIVSVIHIGWKNHYELAEPFIPHHHHLFCTNCCNAIPLVAPELESLIQQIGNKHNFSVTRHYFELSGICQNCRDKKLDQNNLHQN